MVTPLSQMPRDIANRLDRVEKDLERSRRATMRAAAQAAKDEQLRVMRGDAGGDLTLSRVRSGRGAKIGARYDFTADGNVLVKAVGPVPLIANPSKAHLIPRQSARRGRKRLRLADGSIRLSVDHPGTKGKDTWNRGRRQATPVVTRVIGDRTDRTIIRSFRAGD